MNERELDKCLRTIEEMVLDEDKIVTYKYVSRNFGIHVNTAKQLLYLFLVEKQKRTPCPISATYLLAGCTKDGNYTVSIVGEDKIEETYKKFVKISSEHVYSVQKGNADALVKNSEMIYTVDINLNPPERYPIEPKHPIKVITRERPRNEGIGAVASAFERKPEHQKATTEKSSPKKSARKTNQISAFFEMQQRKRTKQDEMTEIKAGSVQQESGKIDEPSTPREVDVERLSLTDNDSSQDEEILPMPGRKREREGKAKATTIEERKKKKRKRIMIESENSESDEEKRDTEPREDEGVTESTQRLRIVDDEDKETVPGNKVKRKKIVEKTFIEDDGYFRTIKEVVNVTDSEEEAPTKERGGEGGSGAQRMVEPARPEKAKETSTKGNPKKQQTLLSFFKKD